LALTGEVGQVLSGAAGKEAQNSFTEIFYD